MKPLFFAVFALSFAQQCAVFEPAIHASRRDGGPEVRTPSAPRDGGPPFLTRDWNTCEPYIYFEDGGVLPLPDGGDLGVDPALRRWNYEYVPCDVASLRERVPLTPGELHGIDAPSEELRAAARLMVGEWTGTLGSSPVTVIFFESGHYSATGLTCSPLNPGFNCDAHQPSWRLDIGNAQQAEGELEFRYAGGTHGTYWMKQVQATETTLRFHLWDRGYGPLSFDLVRDTSDPCAGKNLSVCP